MSYQNEKISGSMSGQAPKLWCFGAWSDMADGAIVNVPADANKTYRLLPNTENILW